MKVDARSITLIDHAARSPDPKPETRRQALKMTVLRNGFTETLTGVGVTAAAETDILLQNVVDIAIQVPPSHP